MSRDKDFKIGKEIYEEFVEYFRDPHNQLAEISREEFTELVNFLLYGDLVD